MIPLDDPTAGGSTPVLAKRKVKTHTAEPAIGIGLAERRRDRPARRCRARNSGGIVANEKTETGVAGAGTFARRK
jgi:hypothetical protein